MSAKSLNGLVIVLATFLLGITKLSVVNLPKWMLSAMITVIGIFKGYSLRTLEIIRAQSKVESGNFGSSLAKRANNIFGLRPSKKRKVHYTGTDNGYAAYSSPYHSILDYFDLANYNDMPKSLENVESFASFMKSKAYFEASLNGYVTALKTWL